MSNAANRAALDIGINGSSMDLIRLESLCNQRFIVHGDRLVALLTRFFC